MILRSSRDEHTELLSVFSSGFIYFNYERFMSVTIDVIHFHFDEVLSIRVDRNSSDGEVVMEWVQ